MWAGTCRKYFLNVPSGSGVPFVTSTAAQASSRQLLRQSGPKGPNPGNLQRQPEAQPAQRRRDLEPLALLDQAARLTDQLVACHAPYHRPKGGATQR